MSNIETVIKNCENWINNHKGENYLLTYSSVVELLAVLKEQEAMEPVTQSSVYDPDTWFFVCGSCKKCVIECGDKFCRWCGQEVKWE